MKFAKVLGVRCINNTTSSHILPSVLVIPHTPELVLFIHTLKKGIKPTSLFPVHKIINNNQLKETFKKDVYNIDVAYLTHKTTVTEYKLEEVRTVNNFTWYELTIKGNYLLENVEFNFLTPPLTFFIKNVV